MKTYTQTEVDALVAATWDEALNAVRELERKWRRWAVSEHNPLVKPTEAKNGADLFCLAMDTIAKAAGRKGRGT